MKARLFIVLAFLGWCVSGHAALAQSMDNRAGGTPISFGGRGWGGAEAVATTPEAESETLNFSIKAGAATDYVYRGTTLSDRRPAIGGVFEVTYGQYYAWLSAASVHLPTQPAAELGLSAGIRPSLAGIDFDLGVTYFAYPDEALPSSGINYWEAALRADYKITETWRVAGGFAYSPDVSNTGAWSWYAAAGLGYDIPAHLLPADLSVSVTGAAGYSWFGDQSPALGGFALPAYLNWHTGVTFTYKAVGLDLRYYDTNLSKENCFVLTGDPGATPGGHVNPVTNPTGLRSSWCGATVVAKLWVALDGASLKTAAGSR
jgi:uncharacterized protein (TIGR02001 family)